MARRSRSLRRSAAGALNASPITGSGANLVTWAPAMSAEEIAEVRKRDDADWLRHYGTQATVAARAHTHRAEGQYSGSERILGVA